MHIPLKALKTHPEPSAATFFRELRDLYTKSCMYCVIATMAEEDLFSAFLTPTSAKEIENARGFSPGMIEHMCDICVNAGFLTKSGEKYHITPAGKTYLTADSPYSQYKSLRNMHSHLKTLWFPLTDRLHHGPHVFDRAQFFHDSSLPAMAASTLCGRIQDTLKEIIHLPEFQDWKRIIDIGGGHGLYAIAIASENPQITAIVQDLPGVIPLTEETIKEYGMEKQVQTLPGDYLECFLGEPESYDMVFASSTPAGTMNIMSDRIAEILKPGGYFINVQPNEESVEDAFSQLEWRLWTFADARETKATWKKKKEFPEQGYLEHLEKHGIGLIRAVTIADPYREGFTIKMLILKKRDR